MNAEQQPSPSGQDGPSTASLILSLAQHNGGNRYLEIGVNKGATFFEVTLPLKVAVDPAFLFDHKSRLSSSELYFAETSDAFFDGIDSNAQLAPFKDPDGVVRFDVIFLDGLHTFEQTWRDFENSVKHAHEKTLWVLDDTIPCDPYSAIPDMERSWRYRASAGLTGLSWHGDVYKCVYALHDLRPEFSYCTLVDTHNPQTVVWRGKQARQVTPLFTSFEHIRQTDYFSILDNSDAFVVAARDNLSKLLDKTLDTPHIKLKKAGRRSSHRSAR